MRTTLATPSRIAIIALMVLLAAGLANAQTYTGFVDLQSFGSLNGAEQFMNNQLWTSHAVLSTMFIPLAGGRATWVVRYPCTAFDTCTEAANYAALPVQTWTGLCSGSLNQYVAETFTTEAAMNDRWFTINQHPFQGKTVAYKGRTVAAQAPWLLVYQSKIEVCQ